MKLLIGIVCIAIVALIVWACNEFEKSHNWPRYEDRHEPDEDDCYCNKLHEDM